MIPELDAAETKISTVLGCLYSDHVALCISMSFGVSVNISEQSKILQKFLNFLNLWGVVPNTGSVEQGEQGCLPHQCFLKSSVNVFF